MMVVFYVYMILDGKITFKEVPSRLKDKVRQMLIDTGNAEYIEE